MPACDKKLVRQNVRVARALYSEVSHLQLAVLRDLTVMLRVSITQGELLFLGGRWYVSHSGLLRIAHRKRCFGIDALVDEKMSEASTGRWVFKATVRRSQSRSFVGYGDADPSNVSPQFHGSEMRVAETRAVNRALRKAYGVGICSVDELGPFGEPIACIGKLNKRSQPANGNGYGGRTVRDHLCQIIRQHKLDASLVKSYASDFCGTKELRDATREQVESFVKHLAKQAEQDRDALICQLNSYLGQKEGAA